MVVQTFGNRILGGIGAPGGGMSETFGAGVTTALNQRDARQVMDFRAQDQAFKLEDRKIAAQQRAAAAAARAKTEALNAEIARIYGVGASTGTTAVGLTLPVTRGESRDRQEPFVNPRYYPTAPVVTAPTAGTVTYKSPKLSYNLDVPAGAPSTTPNNFKTTAQAPVGTRLGVQPAPVVAATLPTFTMPSGNKITLNPDGSSTLTDGNTGEVFQGTKAETDKLLRLGRTTAEKVRAGQTSATPVVPAAPAAVAPAPLAGTGEPVYSNALGVIVLQPNGVLTLDGQPVPPSDPLYNAVSNEYVNLRKRQLLDAQAALTTAGESPLVLADPLAYSTRVAEARQAEAAAQAAVGAAPIQYPVYDGRTDVPVGQLPAGVRAPVTETQTVTTAAAPTSMDFGVGFGAGQTPLSFGPGLGAQPQTPEDMMISQFATQTTVTPAPAAVAGQAAAPATPVQPLPDMGQPGQPNYAINLLLSERDKKVQVIQAQLNAGMTTDAMTSQIELDAIDSKLQAAVGLLAIEEMRDSNAPQRMNEIWTQMKQGRKYEFVPLNDGNVAVYVDGKLQIDSAPMDKIIEQTLSMTNQTYVEQQAALAAVQADAYAKAYGESQGKLPAAQQTALNAADIAVVQAELLAGIELDKDMGLKNNAALQKYIEYTMQQQGQLPQADKAYQYQKMDDGSIAVFDGPNIVSYFFLAEEAGPNGTVNTVIREQKVGQ